MDSGSLGATARSAARLRGTCAALIALATACRSSQPNAAPPDAQRTADVAPMAAEPPPRIFTIERKCMGTKCQVKAFHPDEQLVQRAVERGMAEMDRIEALTTSWTEDSDVARVNRAAGKEAVKVAPDTMAVVKKGLWIAALSRGAFDVTVGVFKGLWKFDEDNDDSIPDFAEVRRRAKLVDYRDVIIDEAAGTVKLRRPGQRLNLEGLAKGYGVQAAVQAIRAAGLNDFIFKAGGDLFASGKKGEREWRVGIQDPRAPRESRIIFELPVVDQAFNTSGDYERFVIKDGVRYHHILDARTGFPARGCRSVTILASDAFLADTLDTAVFAVGAELGMKMIANLPGVEAVIVDAKNRVHVTPGLRDKLVKRGGSLARNLES